MYTVYKIVFVVALWTCIGDATGTKNVTLEVWGPRPAGYIAEGELMFQLCVHSVDDETLEYVEWWRYDDQGQGEAIATLGPSNGSLCGIGHYVNRSYCEDDTLVVAFVQYPYDNATYTCVVYERGLPPVESNNVSANVYILLPYSSTSLLATPDPDAFSLNLQCSANYSKPVGIVVWSCSDCDYDFKFNATSNTTCDEEDPLYCSTASSLTLLSRDMEKMGDKITCYVEQDPPFGPNRHTHTYSFEYPYVNLDVERTNSLPEGDPFELLCEHDFNETDWDQVEFQQDFKLVATITGETCNLESKYSGRKVMCGPMSSGGGHRLYVSSSLLSDNGDYKCGLVKFNSTAVSVWSNRKLVMVYEEKETFNWKALWIGLGVACAVLIFASLVGLVVYRYYEKNYRQTINVEEPEVASMSGLK